MAHDAHRLGAWGIAHRITDINLLFLTPQLPFPPWQGTALRNWGLIKHLSQRHTITLLSFAEAGQSANIPELQAACRRVIALPVPRRSRIDRLRTLASPQPDLARRMWSPEFDRALTDLLDQTAFDIAHIEGLEMAPYLPRIQAALHPPRVIYDAHNAEYLIQHRAFITDLRQPARWPAAAYSWLQLPRLRQFEAATCRAADAVTCVSVEDALVLKQCVPSLDPVILPNSIDVEAYTFYASRLTPHTSRLVLTGKMDYRPNVDAALWFAGDILPRIRATRPEVQFFVVGQKPAPILLKRHGTNGVTVTGTVEDVRPFIAEAAAYVAPLRMGSGTRFKLLEAMALARPIVSTAIGAEGFAVRSGQELLLADAPADFADAVLALLADPGRAQALGRAGQEFVRQHYDWSVIIPKLEAVYRTL